MSSLEENDADIRRIVREELAKHIPTAVIEANERSKNCVPYGGPLRERFDRLQQQRVTTSDRDAVAFFVVAWNAWRDGRRMTKLQRPKGDAWTSETFPKPK
ncbi:MAG: hypothetical protein QM658_13675 [Gordonia sp. (in: high G+C Gram-positive bacteria)]